MSGLRAAVVVPHYRDQRRLDLVLTGLELQTLDPAAFEVVVADDGSPQPPDPGVRPYPVRVVRQPDRGFRAAAARNLGAAATTAPLLCFLDGDTVPGPTYLERVLAAAGGPRWLGVGRRRHADLSTTTPADLAGWFAGTGPAPAELTEPAWLREAYERTDDLRDAGDDAYRFVISAVLVLTRALFEGVGGFEEAFTAYGGEDWELANRCWLAGADFRHVRDAVAWHDGPDFADRGSPDAQRRSRNTEGLTLARFVTDPAARGTGTLRAQPDVVVRLDDRGAEEAAVVRSVASLLHGTDAGVWLREGAAAGPAGALADDPRVHVGEPPAHVLGRSRFQVRVDRPLEVAGATLRDLAELTGPGPVVGPGLSVHRTRDLARGTGTPSALPAGVGVRPTEGVDLQRLWGREQHERERQRSLRTPSSVSGTPSASP